MSDRENELERLRRKVAALEDEARTARGNEALLRSVLDNATDFIARVDVEGRLLFINRVIPGSDLSTTLGRSVLDFVPPDYHDLVLRAFAEVARTGKPTSYECRATGPNGRLADYSTRVGPIKEGDRVVALTLIATDVTHYKATLRALLESEDKLRIAIEATHIGLWSWDPHTDHVTWDEATCRIFGVDADNTPRTRDDYLTLIHPTDRAAMADRVRAFEDTGHQQDLRSGDGAGNAHSPLATRRRAHRRPFDPLRRLRAPR